jgi:hypothetical protein
MRRADYRPRFVIIAVRPARVETILLAGAMRVVGVRLLK